MKASTTRNLVWTATALAVGFCVWKFVAFVALGGRQAATKFPTPDEIKKELRPPMKVKDRITKNPDDYFVFVNVNLSGVRPKPPVESKPADSQPTKVDINPLAEVLGLRMTRIDVKEPQKSVAIVYWKDPQISPADAKKYVALSAGTWFPKPYDRTYRLKRVEERRAIFEKVEKDDQENFAEVILSLTELRSVTASSRPARTPGAMTGHGTESRPMSTAPIPETREVNPHEYILSEKDRDLAKDKGLEMIGRDVHTAPYLDPKTQRPEGLIVKSIRQNSLPSKLGLKENDVVRGVNGSKIRSTADIYAFAKDNPDVKTVTVAVERFGRVVNITYHLP